MQPTEKCTGLLYTASLVVTQPAHLRAQGTGEGEGPAPRPPALLHREEFTVLDKRAEWAQLPLSAETFQCIPWGTCLEGGWPLLQRAFPLFQHLICCGLWVLATLGLLRRPSAREVPGASGSGEAPGPRCVPLTPRADPARICTPW